MPLCIKDGVVFDAQRWHTTNTTRMMDWVRRTGTASIRWYPAIESGEHANGHIPEYMCMPEHLVIRDESGLHAVGHGDWVVRSTEGLHEVISHATYLVEFKPVT